MLRGEVALLWWLGSSIALGAPLYTAPDVAPYLRSDTTALLSNHYLLQSMFALDAAPSTVGLGVKLTPADLAVANGDVASGALTKWNTVAMVGGGKPTTGAAWFAGVNYAHLVSTAFPNLLKDARGERPETIVSFGGGSAVLFAGGAVQGVAAEVGLFLNGADYTSNTEGGFGEGCPRSFGCEPSRPGAPFDPVGAGESLEVTRRSLLLNVEHHGGHQLSALVSEQELASAGRQATRGGLTLLRALSQPYDLFPEAVGLLGAGLDTISPDVDFYGDDAARVRRGAPAEGKRLWQVPLVGDRLADTGLLARVTLQAAPVPALRLVEAGWADDVPLADRTWLQAGARARLYRRDTTYRPSADAYAGLFVADADHDGRGFSAWATAAYDSPDPLVFPAVHDATVLGLQVTLGNPTAMPPPVPTLKPPTGRNE